MKIKNIKNAAYKTTLVLISAGMILTGCGEKDKEDDEVQKEPPVVVIDKEDVPKPPEINGNEEKKPEENPEENGEPNETKPVVIPDVPEQNNRPQPPKHEEPSKPVKDKSIASSWNMLESSAKAGQEYYSQFYTKTRIITKDGHLFNFASGTQITTDYLVNDGRLDRAKTSSDISLMLMRGKDISRFGGSNVVITGTDSEFTVFAFMKHPHANKYIFTSAGGSYGTLSASAYNSLMSSYSTNHGTIRRLTPSNAEYDRILSCIKMYESRYEQYFVRSINIDDKYAFVVLSGRANAATIREYILRYDNGIWEVMMDDLENEGRMPVAINKVLPDCNLAIMPPYSIKDYTMLNDYTAVVDALTKAGYYAKNDTFYYFCGTDEFCYMITDNGKHFLCHNNGGKWDCYRVTDYYDALGRLQKLSDDPPIFILLDLE